MGECCDVYYRYMYKCYCLLVFYYQTVTDNSLTIFASIIIVIILTFLQMRQAKKGIDSLQTVVVKHNMLF